jgi:hypothetical protein
VLLGRPLEDREQLEGRDAERPVVREELRVRERAVGATKRLGDARVLHRHAAHVGLVDHGVAPGHAGLRRRARAERSIVDDDGPRPALVVGVAAQVGGLDEGALEGARARIGEAHGGVVRVTLVAVAWTVDEEAVAEAFRGPGQEAAPHAGGRGVHGVARLVPVPVERGEGDARGVAREDGEAHPLRRDDGAEGAGLPGVEPFRHARRC